jgi:hypothetical protein
MSVVLGRRTEDDQVAVDFDGEGRELAWYIPRMRSLTSCLYTGSSDLNNATQSNRLRGRSHQTCRVLPRELAPDLGRPRTHAKAVPTDPPPDALLSWWQFHDITDTPRTRLGRRVRKCFVGEQFLQHHGLSLAISEATAT